MEKEEEKITITKDILIKAQLRFVKDEAFTSNEYFDALWNELTQLAK